MESGPGASPSVRKGIAHMPKTRRAFAATSQWKLPLAGIAAAGCTGFLVWNLIPSRSERTDTPKPMIVRADGTTAEAAPRQRPGPREMNWETAPEDEGRTYNFENVSGDKDVARQMESLASVVTGSPEGSVALAEDARTLLEPLNTGSAEGFAQAVVALGGLTEPGEDGRPPIDGLSLLFRGLLKYASLDTASVEIRKPTTEIPARDGLSIGMNRNVSADPNTGEEIETLSHTVIGAPVRLFPSAAGEDAKGRLVEMRLPFRTKDSKGNEPDVIALVHMREVAPGQWQPAGFFLDVRNRELMQSVLKELTASRPPQGPG